MFLLIFFTCCFFKVCKILLDSKASPSVHTDAGNTPLHYFVRTSVLSILNHPQYESVLDKLTTQTSATFKNKQGECALHFAAMSGNTAAIRLLVVTKKVDVNTTNKYDRHRVFIVFKI